MATPSPTLIALLILVTASLTALGVGITLFALLRRRRGSTPHCRNCGYNLTGAVSSRCSECGADLESPGATVIGQPIRRRLPIVVGLIILVVGLVPMVITLNGAARNINWYEFKPAALVLRDIRVGSPATATRALRELLRRESLGKLSAHHQSKLADACLAEQVRKVERATVTREAVDYLGNLCEDGSLTSEQAQAMFTGITQQLCLEVRPRILEGDACPYRLSHALRAPDWFRVQLNVCSVRIDDRGIQKHGPGSGSSGFSSGWVSSVVRIPNADVGKHTFEMDVEIEISPGRHDDDPLYNSTRTLSAQFETLSGEPDDYFTLVDSPAMGDDLTKSIAIRDIRIRPQGDNAEVDVHLEFPIRNRPPIDSAFDVMVESSGRVIEQTTLVVPRGTTSDAHGTFVSLPADVGDAVDIRLRSSKELAVRTVDLFEIWAGELLFKNIPVVRLSQDQPFVETKVHSATVVESD